MCNKESDEAILLRQEQEIDRIVLAGLQRHYEKVIHQAVYPISGMLSFCDSYLEKVFGAHFLTQSVESIQYGRLFTPEIQGFYRIITDAFINELPEDGVAFIYVFPQAIIGRYRVDFLIAARLDLTGVVPNIVVVECDGHDFHEKSKEQIRRDRRRDRELQEHGYAVLRYPGSEIIRAPKACVAEVMRHLQRPNLSSPLYDFS